MKSRADRYIFSSGMSLLGLVALASPLFIKVAPEMSEYNAKQQLENTENLNRTRIIERKKTAEVIKKTGLLPEGKTLRIVDYIDSSKRPKLSKLTLEAFLADETIHVYDRSGVCIGLIQQRRFTWKRDDKNACSNAPQFEEN